MKYRPRILAYMDVLRALSDGPKMPTRLAQITNIHYPRLIEYLGQLGAKGLVERVMREGRELYGITPAGLEVHRDWEKVWVRVRE